MLVNRGQGESAAREADSVVISNNIITSFITRPYTLRIEISITEIFQLLTSCVPSDERDAGIRSLGSC
jgi:hypothetical protein